MITTELSKNYYIINSDNTITYLKDLQTMIVTNKYTGRDVTREYLALLEGLITKQEFELITMTIK